MQDLSVQRLHAPELLARVARFLGIDASPALLAATVQVSSFESMSAKANRHHYDDHFLRRFVGPMMGLPAEASHDIIKVRAGGGKVGSRRALAPALKRRLEDKWAEVIAKPTGCATYEAFAASVRRERRI